MNICQTHAQSLPDPLGYGIASKSAQRRMAKAGDSSALCAAVVKRIPVSLAVPAGTHVAVLPDGDGMWIAHRQLDRYCCVYACV